MSVVTNGMSASTTTAAAALETAVIPARSELFTPSMNSGLTTGWQRSPASSARARSASCPTPTTTGSSPAFATRCTVRRSSDSPSISRNSLLRPRRVDAPAASTTPATAPLRSDGMDGLGFLAQVPAGARRMKRQQLADDADGDLFGSVGADVEADGPEHLRRVGANLPEDLFAPRARSEQPDVRRAGLQEAAHPLAIAGERMRLGDDQRPAVHAKRRDVVARAELQQVPRRREAGPRQVVGPMIDDRHGEADVGGVRDERTRVVSGATHEETRRHAEDVREHQFPADLVGARSTGGDEPVDLLQNPAIDIRIAGRSGDDAARIDEHRSANPLRRIDESRD